MTATTTEVHRIKLEKIKKQFLCNTPLNQINWKVISDEATVLDDFLNDTVNSRLNQQRPLKYSYQVAFMKRILNALSETDREATDLFYEILGNLVTLSSTDTVHYKHYRFNNESLSLREDVNIISNGTTGLKTWQASLALSEFIIANPDRFRDKRVLELGSGVGLTGLVLHRSARAGEIILSDSNELVLAVLRENIAANTSGSEPRRPGAIRLPWEDVSAGCCAGLGEIDLVLAADVIFDSSLFGCLSEAMGNLADFSSVGEFVFACTIRNDDTIRSFLTLLDERGFETGTLGAPLQNHFVWSEDDRIEIYSIKKKKKNVFNLVKEGSC